MLFLALRHLFTKKRQTFLTVLGIMLGTGAYVVISGMMLGFQSYIKEQLIDNDAHVKVSAKEEFITKESVKEELYKNGEMVNWVSPPSGRRDNSYIEYPQGWFERLDRDPRVFAYSPQMTSQVIYRRAKASVGGNLVGIDPAKQVRVTNIEKYITAGKLSDLALGGNRLIAGDGLLQKLGSRVGENLLLSLGKDKPVPFKIVGTFHIGIKSIDDSLSYTFLSDAQVVNQTPSRVSNIAIRLFDVNHAADIAAEWQPLSQEKVLSWDQANAGIMSVFKTQDIIRNSMTISILIVAGFGIYNILNMAVSQKKREIAILRSIGYESKDIQYLFLIQGVILGVMGGVVGNLLGLEVCHMLTKIELSGERGIGGNHMIISFDYIIYVKSSLLAFLSSTVASYLPARAAGKLTPIDIIRSEGS